MTDADREKSAIEALRRGDRSAIRVLYELHAARLFRSVLMPVLKDRAAAEDALRETFLAALDHSPEFTGDTALPWLATIARNKGLDALRAAQARGRLAETVASDQPDDPPTPEHLVATVEARELARSRIESILGFLNPRQAKAIRLRLLEDRDRPSCAALMEMTVGAFDVLLFRACKAFREQYVQRYGENP